MVSFPSVQRQSDLTLFIVENPCSHEALAMGYTDVKVTVDLNLRSGVPFVFVGAGKERLIQLLDYSSAAP